jgi:Fe2+ or Zn2+ uptake regulation protein
MSHYPHPVHIREYNHYHGICRKCGEAFVGRGSLVVSSGGASTKITLQPGQKGTKENPEKNGVCNDCAYKSLIEEHGPIKGRWYYYLLRVY